MQNMKKINTVMFAAMATSALFLNVSNAETVLSASNTGSVIDDGTPAWPATVGVIRAGTGSKVSTDLIGFVSFDLSDFTVAELQAATFELDFTVSIFSGDPTSYPFQIDYIGTYANDDMPASGSDNISLWTEATALASTDTISSVGDFSDVTIDLADDSFDDGSYALFRIVLEDMSLLNTKNTQWDVATGITLTVIPEPSVYALLSGVLVMGVVVSRRRSTK
jgi:hypothetical protein